MDLKNLKVGDRVRLTELVSAGNLLGQIALIPNGTEVVVVQVYDAGTEDAAYRVEGRTNLDHAGTGVAFHDEIEEIVASPDEEVPYVGQHDDAVRAYNVAHHEPSDP
jgi:hypothetical protein